MRVPLLMPARQVTTQAVRAAGVAEQSGATVAEAAGWIEPDPFPIEVRPLVAGVLTGLPVLEGDIVKKGETVIGTMESATLLAAHERAQVELKSKTATERDAHERLRWATALLEQKADVRAAEAVARHHIEITKGRIAGAAAAVTTAQARRDRAAADLDGQRKLHAAGGTYPVALKKALAAVASADGLVRERESDLAALQAELERDVELYAIQKDVLDDPRALRQGVETARTAHEVAKAAHAEAATALRIARRELDWCTVKAPVDGVVMKLLAAPGAHVGPGGHAIVALYEPKKLQARIDVPLATVGNVRVGQKVDVMTEVQPGKSTKGVVVRIQRESDLLKNTLQVKVRLIDPDPILRPETLCRALFRGGEKTKTAAQAMFLVPKTAVRNGAVYVVGDGRARRIAVEAVGERGTDAVVRGDLSPTHRVILDEVQEGERVQ